MTQALFTSMTGLNAGTEQLTVVSDNVANMNTTAYKTSRVDFQDIWYATKTTGTNSSRVSGGTNPYQVGVGVQCASITKDFSASSTNTTGRTEDMAITGDGWFTVQNSDGKVLLTRDGTFSLDENGYLCTASGCKVLGMDEMESYTNSITPIKMPTAIKVVEEGTKKAQFDLMTSDELNALGTSNSGFTTGGEFIIYYSEKGGTPKKLVIDLSKDSDGNPMDISKMSMKAIADEITEIIDKDQDATGLFDLVTGDGTFSFVAEKDITLKFENTDDIKKSTNFLNVTNIANATPVTDPDTGKTTYESKELSKSAKIGEVDDITSSYTKNYSSFSVGRDGLVTVSYGDGSILTIKANENGSTYFSYQTSSGVIIDADVNMSETSQLYVDPDVLTKANMQLQLAKVVNNGGLVAEGNNMYSVGVNCGDVLYTAANTNGVGGVVTGALEASNVDLAQQFSNMILAQRLVQANSQVFSGANQLLETLVYLGQ